MTSKDLFASILQQAIKGELVNHLDSDGSAQDLIDQIENEKKRQIDEYNAANPGKKQKKYVAPSPIPDDEIPFPIPENWKWVRMCEIFEMQAGKSISASELSDIKNETHQYPCFGGNGIRGYIGKYNNEGTHCIVGRQGALCGNVKVAQGLFYATEHAVVVSHSNCLDVQLIYFFLTALNLNQYATATAQPGLAVSTIIQTYFPLPPLAEQSRIVAKLEALKPLVEEYGKANDRLEALNKKLPDELKASVLQEALRGRLTTQLPSDGDAQTLIDQIEAEKAKSSAKNKKYIPPQPVNPDEAPFQIPDNWKWVRLGEIAVNITTKPYQILASEVEKVGKFLAISQSQNYIDGYSNDEDKVLNKIPIILFGDHTRVVKYVEIPFVVSADGVKLIYTDKIFSKYLYYVIKFNASKIASRGYQRHYSVLEKQPIPLPPLAEQSRIVAQIEEVFAQIDNLRM